MQLVTSGKEVMGSETCVVTNGTGCRTSCGRLTEPVATLELNKGSQRWSAKLFELYTGAG